MKQIILEQYKIIVDFLGKALGPDYEVVLQDLTNGKNAIIAIANNNVSGRQLGSPLTNTALQLLSSKVYQTSNYV
ncbi:MAG: PAS domain-containing protein, partial [Lachnospiraceae bacterium]|nr:PAS domain-containing protein [Lachnospiraceae bacterium]